MRLFSLISTPKSSPRTARGAAQAASIILGSYFQNHTRKQRNVLLFPCCFFVRGTIVYPGQLLGAQLLACPGLNPACSRDRGDPRWVLGAAGAGVGPGHQTPAGSVPTAPTAHPSTSSSPSPTAATSWALLSPKSLLFLPQCPGSCCNSHGTP